MKYFGKMSIWTQFPLWCGHGTADSLPKKKPAAPTVSFEIPRFRCRKRDNRVPHKITMGLTGLRPSKQIRDNKRGRKKSISNTEQKTGVGFPPTRKCPRRVTLAELLNMGIALCQSVSERERAASRCHRLMSVFDACPNVCVCVWERVKLWHGKYGQHAAPAAAAPITGPSLRHPELMTDARTQVWCARKRNADRHHKTPRGRATWGWGGGGLGGHTRAEPD